MTAVALGVFQVVLASVLVLSAALNLRAARAKLRRLEAPNLVEGMVLPFPDDPRWKWRRCRTSKRCSGTWKIGAVEACEDHGLVVGHEGIRTPDGDAYCDRVLAAQRERLALAAAIGDDA